MSSSNRGSTSLLVRLLALLAMLSLVAAACGGGDDDDGEARQGTDTTEQTEEQPKQGGTLTVGLEAESAGWQPCVDSHATPGQMVMKSIYDPLMMRDADGKVKPYLAESLKSSDDLKTWTLKLRSGVKFHDGTPLTAAVLKDNFDNNTKAPTSRCASLVKDIESVEVIDDLTLQYNLARPFGPFPDLLSGDTGVGLPFSPENAKAKGADVSANPVGTGPFVFVSWQRDSKLEVKKNPDYWQKGLPYLDTVIFRPIPDEQARLAALSSGDVDMMHSLRQSLVKEARGVDGIERYESLGNNAGGAIMNVAVAPVNDKRVRQALAHAIKQEDLIKVLGGEGLTPPATQPFSPDSPWYSEKVAAAWPKYDEAKAKELYNAYVNDPNRTDGKKPGEPVSIQFNCPPDPSLIELSQLYQQFWGKIGFQVELKQVEQATHINNAVGKPPFTSADYMINCWRIGSQADPDTVLFNQYGDPEGNAANVTNFDNDKAQEFLRQGRETKEFDERKKAYENLNLLLADEVPHLFTGYTATVVATKPFVKGIETWTFPNGDKGDGAPSSEVRIRSVWLDK